MSYDVRLADPRSGKTVSDDWINHTSNTAGMIKEVCGSYPSQWIGKTGAELLPALRRGILLLENEPKRYKLFEAPNCWGTVSSTCDFLKRVARECMAHPDAIIDVSY